MKKLDLEVMSSAIGGWEADAATCGLGIGLVIFGGPITKIIGMGAVMQGCLTRGY